MLKMVKLKKRKYKMREESLRFMEWERIKGSLRALLIIVSEDNFTLMQESIDEFVDHVENCSLLENERVVSYD
jgi:hypothetical protein